jgi:hypothetical protein
MDPAKQAEHYLKSLQDTNPDENKSRDPKGQLGLVAIAAETLQKDGKELVASYEDVVKFKGRLVELLGDRTPLLYTNNLYWKTKLGNPPAIKGTKLWWPYYPRYSSTTLTQRKGDFIVGDALDMVKNISPQGSADDPYKFKGNAIGTYSKYFMRQFSDTTRYQMHNGSKETIAARPGKTVRRYIDANVCFEDFGTIETMAGLPQGSVEYPLQRV